MGETNHKKVTTVYLTPEQEAALEILSSKTKVRKSEYIRMGIDTILERYKEIIRSKRPTVIMEK